MKRVLVTGCSGFVGRNLVPMLMDEGFEVWGVDVRDWEEGFPGTGFRKLDLSDRRETSKTLARVKPEAIIHLAAMSSAGRSFAEPLDTIRVNLLSTLTILEHVRIEGAGTRILAVGSAEEYGPVDREKLPLREDMPPNPVNPYALSKVFQEDCCKLYSSLYEVEVVMARSFNHTGPHQTETFVLPSLAKQITEIKLGMRPPELEVGDLQVKRDFLDVRDVAGAYVALLLGGKRGEVYNVCSGKSWTLEELLGKLSALAGVTPRITVSQARLRPVDTRELVGDNSKIVRDTGWRPRIGMDDTLSSLLDYWEERLGGHEREREDA